ncbi:hypothetical protein J3Q64DRAFT_1706011 [Phycomyces blakesleeanus]|uniref:PiggyBac transposable element-derived protein domain-containing protein n=1 Tax=Phycomyces blakesleeanus TaxID=4837 RepID=A0ABR3BB36_PHYBL
MCLYEVKVVQKRSESRRRIYMDMLYTNFHVLTFIRVKFFLTTETGSFDEEIPTNFFILGRVVNAPQYFDPNFKNLHSNYKKLLEIHTNYPWLEGETMWSYLCFNKDSKYNTRKLWTLDYKETLTIKKAFEKYSPTDPKTSKTQRKRHPGGLALQRYWRSDLPNGYARILCGHVQGCYFDYVYLNFTRRKEC